MSTLRPPPTAGTSAVTNHERQEKENLRCDKLARHNATSSREISDSKTPERKTTSAAGPKTKVSGGAATRVTNTSD